MFRLIERMNNLFFYFVRNLCLLLLILVGSDLHAQNQSILKLRKQLQAHSKSDTATIHILNDLAFGYRNTLPDSTIYFASKALSLALELNYKLGQANAYKQLAIGNYYKSNAQSAKVYNRKALALFKEVRDKKGEAATLNNMGMLYHNEGKFDLALHNYSQSLKIRTEIKDIKGIGDSHNNIGNIYSDKGNYKKAIERYFEALQIRESLGDSISIANSYASIAGVYFLLGKYNDSEKYARIAMHIQQLIGERVGYIQTAIDLGGIFTNRKQYDSAVFYFAIAYQISREIDDQADEIVCLGNFGEVYNEMNMPDSALYYYETAIPKCKAYDDITGLALCEIGIGKAKLLKGDLQGSLTHTLKGYTLALGNHNKAQIYKGAKQLAQVFQKLKKYEEANQYLNTSILYKDSLLVEENAQRTYELEYNYLLEKKQNEIILLEKDKSIQSAKSKFQYAITIGLMVIVVFLVVFVYFIQRSRDSEIKAKELVTKQKLAIEQQAQNLDELNTYKNKIFSILSHDIRNPISSLNQVVELINEDVLTIDDFKHIKDRLHGQLKSINILLENVLNWSKSQLEGEAKPNKIHLKLRPIVEQNLALFDEFIQQKKLHIENLVSSDFTMLIDSNHLDVAIRNILFNAIKFTFDGGVITIDAVTLGDEVRISVSDTGKGMDQETLKTLFSFNKQPGIYGTKGERGAGIGLILTEEFVNKNGGEILVQSKENEGSTFSLVFPV